MSLTTQQVAGSLDATASNISEADQAFEEFVLSNRVDVWSERNTEWYLKLAYSKLLTLAEALQLPLLRADILRDFEAAIAEGLLTQDDDPRGVHLKWAGPARRYVWTIQSTFAAEPARTVTKDLESILRAATYSITDSQVFGVPPRNEPELHLRLEAVLKCVFPKLKHKPTLTKPIKNFEPDTGISSIQTLIEYKFLDSAAKISKIADELLADTRGYTSPEWTSFVYVIYETRRFKPESEWRQLLRDCGVDARTVVVVLSGEATEPGRLGAKSQGGRPRKSSREPDGARPRRESPGKRL